VPKIDTLVSGVKLHDVNKSTVAAVAFDVKRHVTDWSMEEIMALHCKKKTGECPIIKTRTRDVNV
jgi:hypothetical protein